MLETKEFKTIEQQINALDERKLKFKNRKKAQEILSKYNYFDIINGFETILLQPETAIKEYKNVYFEDFWDLYKFDMKLKKQTLFKVFDVESRMRAAISYHFASEYCNTIFTTMNYIKREFYQAPNPSDRYLTKRFKDFDLFRTTQYDGRGAVIKDSFIDALKKEKAYVGKYIEPPFWVVIKSFPLGSLYYTYLFLRDDVKQKVLRDFHLSLSDSSVFEQAVYVLKEVRNQCAHLELITRFRLKRTRKLKYYNDVTKYAGLSRTDLNYMDVVKIFKIFGGIQDLKWTIVMFYIKMCIKGRKKIAEKILAKMGRKSLWAWIKL